MYNKKKENTRIHSHIDTVQTQETRYDVIYEYLLFIMFKKNGRVVGDRWRKR